MLIVCHWNACVQFLIVVLQDFPADSWVVRNGIESLPWWKQYVHALFQALSHMFCLGYGR
jgi:hyperpolarization activated cyclic nucleotide-gated potassium channel 2